MGQRFLEDHQMSQSPDSPPPDGAPVTPTPKELRDPPDGPVSDKDEPDRDEPGEGTSPDPRTPYGPDEGPPAGEDSETKSPSP